VSASYLALPEPLAQARSQGATYTSLQSTCWADVLLGSLYGIGVVLLIVRLDVLREMNYFIEVLRMPH